MKTSANDVRVNGGIIENPGRRIAHRKPSARAHRLPPQLPPQYAPNEPRTAASADQTALETGNLTAPTLPPEQRLVGSNYFRCFQRGLTGGEPGKMDFPPPTKDSQRGQEG